MNEDDWYRYTHPLTIVLAVAAILICIPQVSGALYDLSDPGAALVNNKPLPGYEAYLTELHRSLSERDLYQLAGDDEGKLRALYETVARDHTAAAVRQARRQLLSYGSLLLFSIAVIFYQMFVYRRSLKRPSAQ